jgi:hypothetical protein
MTEGTQLTQPQRKALVDMISESYSCPIWCRAKEQYDETRDTLSRSFVQEMTQENGVKSSIDGLHQLREQVQTVKRQLDEATSAVSDSEKRLAALGFELEDDGSITLSRRAPDALKSSIEKRLDKALGTKEQVLTRPFTAARLKLLTVATPEEAEKIVEPLLNFEVTVK